MCSLVTLPSIPIALSAMRARGWSNGKPSVTGAGYGVAISTADRDQSFDKGWSEVRIDLDGRETIEVALTPSFWRTCTELRHRRIGAWMMDRGLAPWTKGRPPEMILETIGKARFRLTAR